MHSSVFFRYHDAWICGAASRGCTKTLHVWKYIVFQWNSRPFQGFQTFLWNSRVIPGPWAKLSNSRVFKGFKGCMATLVVKNWALVFTIRIRFLPFQPHSMYLREINSDYSMFFITIIVTFLILATTVNL